LEVCWFVADRGGDWATALEEWREAAPVVADFRALDWRHSAIDASRTTV
jgi:hypothetical protein